MDRKYSTILGKDISMTYPIGIKHRIEYPFNKYLMYKSALTSSITIFESNYARDLFVSKYNLKLNNTSVVNIGKDENLTKIRNMNYDNYDEFKPFILFVGHLYPYKQIPEMLRAFCNANELHENKYTLLIAGDNPIKKYYELIKSTIAEKSAENTIKLLGLVSRENMNILYKKCEFLIFPSPCENFSYTLVEAMSFGVPIVCSNTTAMPETCGNAAIYFDPFNTDDICEKINYLLSNPNIKIEMRRNLWNVRIRSFI